MLLLALPVSRPIKSLLQSRNVDYRSRLQEWVNTIFDALDALTSLFHVLWVRRNRRNPYLLFLAFVFIQHVNIVEINLLLAQSSFRRHRICALILLIVITLLISRDFPSLEGSHLKLILRHVDFDDALFFESTHLVAKIVPISFSYVQQTKHGLVQCLGNLSITEKQRNNKNGSALHLLRNGNLAGEP